LPASVAAEVVEVNIPQNGIEPRPKARIRTISMNAAHGLHQTVLDKVVSLIGIPGKDSRIPTKVWDFDGKC
jgi:hypothetical protein